MSVSDLGLVVVEAKKSSGAVNDLAPLVVEQPTTSFTSTFQPTASIASVQKLGERIAALESSTTTLSDNVATATTTANSAASTVSAATASSVPQTEVDVSSQITGSNMLFSTGTSFVENSAALYYNGQRLRNPAEFTEVRTSTPHKIQLTFTPDDGDSLIVVFSESQ